MARARTLSRILMAAAAAVSATVAAPGPSIGADLAVAIDVDPGICGEPRVLSTIMSRFRHQVTHVPNLPDVAIDDFTAIRLNRYEPAREASPIGRRYCEAIALLSDGRSRDVWYLVEEGQGFASIGDNVEFCVAGFDRWYVYNSPYCRVLQ